jgi:Rod binding domain-containing protein
MSTRVASVAAAPATAPDAKRAAKLHDAARDFESLFVKQLLTAANIGGGSKEDGYTDMAVDGLAAGIERGGGLGLARRIEESLTKTLGLSASSAPPAKNVGGR